MICSRIFDATGYRSIVGWVRFLSLFKNCTHIRLLSLVGDTAAVYRVLKDVGYY